MTNLDDLRKSLDNIDSAIVSLLAERFRVTQKVGEYKKENNLPPVDEAREASQFERLEKKASESGLDSTIVKKVFRLIIDEVVKRHKEMISTK